jgi:molybdopterin-guanine dinucleotide biosynthesis protein A
VGYEAVAWGTDPIDPFFNINDSDDLARAEALLKSR